MLAGSFHGQVQHDLFAAFVGCFREPLRIGRTGENRTGNSSGEIGDAQSRLQAITHVVDHDGDCRRHFTSDGGCCHTRERRE